MSSTLDISNINQVDQVSTLVNSFAKLESVMSQVLHRLSTVESWIDSQKEHPRADTDVTALSRDQHVAGSALTPLIEQCRCIYARLSKLKMTNNNNKTTIDSNAVKTLPPLQVTSSDDLRQLDEHFAATMQALQLQLMHVKEHTRPIQLSKESIKTHQRLLQQAQAISGSNQVEQEQQFELQSLVKTLRTSKVSSSKVQQLELLVNSNCIAARDFEQYEAITDVLADDSVSTDTIATLDTVVNLLAHHPDFRHLDVPDSTQEQRISLKNLCSKLKVLNSKRKQLQTFIDNSSQVSDPALRRTLDSQQVIVKAMQREVDGYRQEMSARVTSEWQQLRETLAGVAIQAILDSVNRSREKCLTTLQFESEVTIPQLEGSKQCIDIMSVSDSGELLTGSKGDRMLYIYEQQDTRSHVIAIPTYRNDALYDAVWTPQGNVVYTTESNNLKRNRVVTLTRSGDVIAQTRMNDARRVSASAIDDVIYVACAKDGVYQSTDNGVTWSHVFKPPDRCELSHAIKVSSDRNSDTFWCLETRPRPALREYTLDKTDINKLEWRRVTLTDGDFRSRWRPVQMAFDGSTNLFAVWLDTDSSRPKVLVYSGSEQNERILDLSEYFEEESEHIVHMAVNCRSNRLALGLTLPGLVRVFTLTYE